MKVRNQATSPLITRKDLFIPEPVFVSMKWLVPVPKDGVREAPSRPFGRTR